MGKGVLFTDVVHAHSYNSQFPESQHSQTPNIDLWAVLPARDEEFGSGVLGTAAVGLQETALLLGITETEICVR